MPQLTHSPRYFGTDGIRGPVGEDPMTPDVMLKLGYAIGQILKASHKPTVLIGRDTRVSGPLLEAALSAGLMASRIHVLSAGIVPTPAVAYLTKTLHADMGIVISASHNPYTDNGIKFFSEDGTKISDTVEQAIEAFLQDTPPPQSCTGTTQGLEDAAGRYIEFCKSAFVGDFPCLTLVVDGANGALSHIAPTLFTELGARVIPIHCKPNGLNINDHCGSTAPQALQQAILTHQADIGLAVDGDGDRLIMVDHTGTVVDGDELLFIITKWYQAKGRLNGGVVGTLMSNAGLAQALHKANIPFIRTQVGDKFVLEALVTQHWQLGGEASGHIICRDKTPTGDALIAALRVFSALSYFGKTLYDLKQGMHKWPQIIKNIPTKQAKQVASHPEVQTQVATLQKTLGNTGRIILRPSGTEPILRVMVEAENLPLAEKIAEQLTQFILDTLG